MSIRQYLNTEGNNIGKLTGNMLAIDVAGNLTKSITANGSVLLTGTGGGSGVDSVNSFTGVVLLDCDDIPETATREYITSTEKAQIVTNTNDIATLQTDVTGLQLDVTNIQNDINNNNGLNELTRNSGLQLPASVIPSLGITEFHQYTWNTQNISNNSWSTLTGGTVNNNVGTGTFNVNGVFTCGATGTYAFYLVGLYNPNVTGYRSTWWNINGSSGGNQSSAISPPAGGVGCYVTYTIIQNLTLGQTAFPQFYQNSGGALGVIAIARITRIQ